MANHIMQSVSLQVFMIKRVFDIAASLLGLLLLSPVIAIIAWQVRRNLGSPVFFRQTRPGLNGKPFQMVKFRTMRDAFDEDGKPLPDSEQITPFGRFCVPPASVSRVAVYTLLKLKSLLGNTLKLPTMVMSNLLQPINSSLNTDGQFYPLMMK